MLEWSAISAMLTLFLVFCMREGNPLGWWLPLVSKGYLVFKNPHLLSQIEYEKLDLELYESRREWLISEASFISKPLGWCAACFNIWVSLPFYFIQNLTIKETLIYFLFSNFLVRLFHERLL